jgi:hypothetical protein
LPERHTGGDKVKRVLGRKKASGNRVAGLEKEQAANAVKKHLTALLPSDMQMLEELVKLTLRRVFFFVTVLLFWLGGQPRVLQRLPPKRPSAGPHCSNQHKASNSRRRREITAASGVSPREGPV